MPERRRLNAVLRRVARLLVPLNYARGERFDHDPALKFGAVPRLEAAMSLASASAELRPFMCVGLTREANKISPCSGPRVARSSRPSSPAFCSKQRSHAGSSSGWIRRSRLEHPAR